MMNKIFSSVLSFHLILLFTTDALKFDQILKNKISQCIAVGVSGVCISGFSPGRVDAAGLSSVIIERMTPAIKSVQSNRGWVEEVRQKRTIAIKAMNEKGMLDINTDDGGNQYLSLPWLPDQKILYKKLSISQKLKNEVFAGAAGEIAKDILLHPVDTAKTRRQAKKKNSKEEASLEPIDTLPVPVLDSIKGLYAGFPIVLIASIPQGATFFLVKKGVNEVITAFAPTTPKLLTTAICIALGVASYWSLRTPAEVLKTKIQTAVYNNVTTAINAVKESPAGFMSLYKHYSVMLWLDIPFQVINFILLGALSDAVASAGYESTIVTRLFCGIACGMISAAVTCPIDTCKTRMIGRDPVSTGPVTSTASPSQTRETTDKYALSASSPSTNLEYTSVATTTVTKSFSSQSGYEILGNGSEMLQSYPSAQVLEAIEELNSQPITQQLKCETETTEGDTTVRRNVLQEMVNIARTEGPLTLFSGIKQRLLYTGLANGVRIAAYGTARMDLMMRSLDEL